MILMEDYFNITFKNVTYYVAYDDAWWEENEEGKQDYHFVDLNGKYYVFKNSYISGLEYEGLDYISGEKATIIGNPKHWGYDVEQTLESVLDKYPPVYYLNK